MYQELPDECDGRPPSAETLADSRAANFDATEPSSHQHSLFAHPIPPYRSSPTLNIPLMPLAHSTCKFYPHLFPAVVSVAYLDFYLQYQPFFSAPRYFLPHPQAQIHSSFHVMQLFAGTYTSHQSLDVQNQLRQAARQYSSTPQRITHEPAAIHRAVQMRLHAPPSLFSAGPRQYVRQPPTVSFSP